MWMRVFIFIFFFFCSCECIYIDMWLCLFCVCILRWMVIKSWVEDVLFEIFVCLVSGAYICMYVCIRSAFTRSTEYWMTCIMPSKWNSLLNYIHIHIYPYRWMSEWYAAVAVVAAASCIPCCLKHMIYNQNDMWCSSKRFGWERVQKRERVMPFSVHNPSILIVSGIFRTHCKSFAHKMIRTNIGTATFTAFTTALVYMNL